MLRYLTAGESHGPELVVIVDGMPAGLPLVGGDIDRELARRQAGYGRGGRMSIERDQARLIGGVRRGRTTGGPIAIAIENRDHLQWREIMDPEPGPERSPVLRPRPGHADFAGVYKYRGRDIRDVIERASARETAARTAAGAVARRLLAELGIGVSGWVSAIGGSRAEIKGRPDTEVVEASPVRCPDPDAERKMIQEIDAARSAGDSVGGVVEAWAVGVLVGLGSYVQWDLRLDGRLAGAIMSIPGIKGVELGDGFLAAGRRGSEVHDPFGPGWPPSRTSNRAGGLEGGVTNGQPVVVRAAMKPIPTLGRPLPTVDLLSGQVVDAHVERRDSCAVASCVVVVEAALCWELARAVVERYGGDDFGAIAAAAASDRRRAW